MKKISFITLILAAVLLAGTGCLKDKGFDRHEYGINDPDASPNGIGFISGPAIINAAGLDVSGDVQSISGPLVISLLSAAATTADVHVTVALDLDTAVIHNWNATHLLDPVLVPLDPSLYSLVATNLVIPAGQTTVAATVNVSSTLSLDPNTSYAVVVRLTSADAGYVIATNENEILLKINIKNKYDGKYDMTGYHNRSPYDAPYVDVPMQLITVGPADVAYFWSEANDFGHPFGTGGGGLGWYGNGVAPVISFDLATDEVTNVYGTGAGGPPITLYTGTIPTHNYYDPATHTIYVAWEYNNNPARGFFDTLVFTGPR